MNILLLDFFQLQMKFNFTSIIRNNTYNGTVQIQVKIKIYVFCGFHKTSFTVSLKKEVTAIYVKVMI